MEKPYGIIYMIKNKVNGKIYFGQTIEEKGFRGRYRNGQWWKYTSNDHLKNSADKHGHENFTVVEQFDIAYSKQELDLLEDLYICLYNTMDSNYGYNKKRGGSHGKLSESSKQKLSEKTKGELNPMYGRKHSEESKQKMSKELKGKYSGEKSVHYGKKHSEERKQKQSERQKVAMIGESNPMYGKKHKDETRELFSQQRKGNTNSTKKVRCVNTGEIFNSAKEAAQYFGLVHGSITRVCRGERPSIKGYKFEYIEKD